jgi:PAS domain S-box-containing protein
MEINKDGVYSLLKYVSEGILISDNTGKIITVNPAVERIFGYKNEELIGNKIEILVPNRYAEKHKTHRKNYYKNPAPRSMGERDDIYGRRKDGTEVPLEISLSQFGSSNNGEKFTIAFIIDISNRKIAELKQKEYSAQLKKEVELRTIKLREVIGDLEKTKASLYKSLVKEKELNMLKSRFVSTASHEFRTPLTTILSSLSLIKKYGELNKPEMQEKHMERIRSSANNLTDILDDILSISKLEEGKIQLSIEEFDIKAFTSEIVNEMQYEAKKGQEIHYHHEGEELNVMLDKKILRHIMLNLLSNAIKFSDEPKPIKVNTSVSKRGIKIQVEDEGIGLSETDQKHLFERFFRGQNASSIKGTGLGLYIVSKYVELLGGKIEFKSKLKEGTTFFINISKSKSNA